MPTYFENFEAATSLTGVGWAGDTGFAAIDTTSALNGVRCVKAVVDASAAHWAYYNTIDAAGGDATASTVFKIVGSMITAVFTRGSGAAFTAGTYYGFQSGAGEGPVTALTLTRVVGGTTTVLGSVTVAGGLTPNAAYTATVSAVGTAIKARMQRSSDGFYLQAGGTFAATAVDCMAATDATITGPGKSGVFWYNTGGNAMFFDDFTVVTAGVAVASAMAMTGPGGGYSGVASGAFTLTPNGAYTGTATPAVTGGGTFTPATVSWAADATAKTFTYTPASAGAKTISVASSPALTGPTALAYSSVAAPSASATPFAADFGAGHAGLAAVGLTLFNPDGTTFAARSAGGAVEAAAGSGLYRWPLDLPAGWSGFVAFDSGESPPVWAFGRVEVSGTRLLAGAFGAGYGSLATVGLALTDAVGTVVRARATANVAELVAGTGYYALTAAVPAAARYALWDTGGGTPAYAGGSVPVASAASRPIVVGG